MARKPSAMREPKVKANKIPDNPKNSLSKIKSREEFDSLARVYHSGTPYALPHIMFIVDRKNKDKVYYINSQRFRFHKDFLLATFLVPRGADVFKPIYLDTDRRFIAGTIAWQKPLEKFTWELWEGDLATAALIEEAHRAINASFFTEVAYKPNSDLQEKNSFDLKIPIISQDELNRNQVYLALNTGEAVGRIHIIDKLDDTVEIGDNEIVILKELPQSLPPVRGIIVAKPSSPLSHINILARGWNIPNVYIKDADKLFREYDTYVFKLEATLTDYKLTPASAEEIRTKFASPDQQVPPVDLQTKRLAGIAEMRKKDSRTYGSKAANQGEIIHAKIPGVIIPDGFSIPFYWYADFMKRNGFNDRIADLLDDNKFVHNPKYRREKLEELRADIIAAPFDAELARMIVDRWRTQLGGRPVFVRSSSNSEDLPNFSGAGLYSSVANVRNEQKLIEAVKRVWASLWRFEAYEARVRNYVSQTDVYMSALVQVGVDMQKGGVMITADPFDPKSNGVVYISAVCGHNSRVVDNSGIPEQLLFSEKSNSIAVMTLSQIQNPLKFDENGDLKETSDRCADRRGRVLSDSEARRLASAAMRIRKVFGSRPQDIEWGILNGRLYIVQSRPFIENNR
ncbi:MAG TPA: PEP/pyruvate-binding domain-containing protein [Pyrinomonadaceae bacterium]|nr:PEP/pyruvate-binding domain-containing protein [Pyrinomonadaceae bacterium]